MIFNSFVFIFSQINANKCQHVYFIFYDTFLNLHRDGIDSNWTQVRSDLKITGQTGLNPRLSTRGNLFNSSLSVCPLFNIYRKENCNTHFVVNANINVLSHEYVSSPYCLFMHLFIHFSRLWICRDLVAGVALWEYCRDRYTERSW